MELHSLSMSLPSAAPALLPHPTLSAYYAHPAEKSGFLRDIFDDTAQDYDQIESLLSLGSGRWYRRQALRRAGLAVGMAVLDVAIGTGLVAREEVGIVGDSGRICGIDPSLGMLRRAAGMLPIAPVLGRAERLPFPPNQFDFLSMGYALRHMTDLRAALAEFYRVLRPGGRLCILEITPPASHVGHWLLRAYMRQVVPLLTRIRTGRKSSQLLWQYYWDTIEACLPAATVMAELGSAGFASIARHVELGIFSEYTAVKS
jgi:demethylmenaquinone methyltransferase/2-methoxy-6-polyprenyl-1,4-benzoquinol methylase